MKCPNCQNIVQEDAIFCDQCGTRLPRSATDAEVAAAQQPAVHQEMPTSQADTSQGARCPNCGAINTPGEMFCGECGTPLSAPHPEVDTGAPGTPATTHEPVRQAATTSHTCPDCGATVAEGEQFCYACGAELQVAATPPTTPPALESQGAALSGSAEPAMPAQTEQAPVQPKSGAATILDECPACGAKVTSGDAFCEFCGAALIRPQEAAPVVAPAPPAPLVPAAEEPPTASPATTVQAAPAVETRAVGPRLVVVSNGAEIPLVASKETVVGREDPYSGIFPDVDLSPHGGEEGGVSRRHFKIMAASGQYRIEDLNSTNYTLLNRNRLQPGAPSVLKDGDEIRAGRIRLVFKAN